MTFFNPPISERPTEELILIANGTTEDWQQEGIDQAKSELQKRNISREYQNKVFEKWEQKNKRRERAYQQKLERNKEEGYSLFFMFFIFLIAPLLIKGRWFLGPNLRELKQENYQKKFKQRLILLIAGFTFWIILIGSDQNEYERKRQLGIDTADISEWERKYYGTDSLPVNKKK